MKPFFAGNWKMYQGIHSSTVFLDALLARQDLLQTVDIGIFPPFPLLPLFQKKLEGTGFLFGAQNMHWEEQGAFTGEVSSVLLKEMGTTHVILGHSERRQLFHETDEAINKKIFAAQQKGICPIFCVGETLAEREAEQTKKVIERQLTLGLKNVSANLLEIAYEPVWAIGTGKVASPEQANDIHVFIKSWLMDHFPQSQVRVLYGGSVKPDNIVGLMAQKEIDGALIGGASLSFESFEKIFTFSRTTS